jgi:hypothetical protein
MPNRPKNFDNSFTYKINDDGTTEPITLEEFANQTRDDEYFVRKVVKSTIYPLRKNYIYSAFLAVNQTPSRDTPTLFETMLFDNGEPIESIQATTIEEIYAEHGEMVRKVDAQLKQSGFSGWLAVLTKRTKWGRFPRPGG